MENSKVKGLLLLFLIFSVMLYIFFIDTVEINSASMSNNGIDRIDWEKPIKSDKVTIIKGTTKKKIMIAWIINADNRYNLVLFPESIKNQHNNDYSKLLFLNYDDNVYFLFEVVKCTYNINNMNSLSLVARVNKNNLFSVVDNFKGSFREIYTIQVSKIQWGKVYNKNDNAYIKGELKASFGKFNVYWKKNKENKIDLITINRPWAGELPLIEEPLFVWCDNHGYALICMEEKGQINTKINYFLNAIAKVPVEDLKYGLNIIQYLP